MKTILLDTHAAIWSARGELPDRFNRVVAEAAERRALLLSPITAWEIGILVSKKRLKLDAPIEEYVNELFAPNIVVAAFSPMVALKSTTLPGVFHSDPADRVLVATAAAYGAHLMTRDKAILDYAKRTKHIQCIAC